MDDLRDGWLKPKFSNGRIQFLLFRLILQYALTTTTPSLFVAINCLVIVDAVAMGFEFVLHFYPFHSCGPHELCFTWDLPCNWGTVAKIVIPRTMTPTLVRTGRNPRFPSCLSVSVISSRQTNKQINKQTEINQQTLKQTNKQTNEKANINKTKNNNKNIYPLSWRYLRTFKIRICVFRMSTHSATYLQYFHFLCHFVLYI